MRGRRELVAFVLVLFLSAVVACAGEPGGMGGPARGADVNAEATRAGAVDAAPETWKRSTVTANTPRLMVGDREELPLRAMHAGVTVDGFRARVVVDYWFENDTGRAYEGTFRLRLPDEASPYYFAFGKERYVAADGGTKAPFIAAEEARTMRSGPLEIMRDRGASWEEVKEARIVPREQGRVAYHQTVRGRIDPTLLEWEGAGIFHARVFPIPARSLARIVVGYDVDLTKIGDDLLYRFDLPQVAGVRPVVDLAVADLGGVASETTPPATPFVGGGSSFYRFDAPAGDAVTLRLKSPGPMVLEGSDAETGDFFAARVDLPPDVLPPAPKSGPRDAIFLIDTSLGANPDQFNVWRKLLRALLEKNRDAIGRFAVLFFDVDARFWKRALVDNTPENVDAVLAYADGLSLEGASDLGAALAAAASPPWPSSGAKPDVFLLSDGAATWGESDPHALAHVARGFAALYAYRTGLAGTGAPLLSELTRESGGALFSVTGESELETAATAHRSRPFRLTEAKVDGAHDVLIAGRPSALFPGQSLLVVGRGAPSEGAELALLLQRDGEPVAARLKLGRTWRSSLAPRVYGQVATEMLEEIGGATGSGGATAYATQFRITGKTCSLLMLDNPVDEERSILSRLSYAGFVRDTPASTLAVSAGAEVGRSFQTEKGRFLELLEHIARSTGSFEPPAIYKKALAQMPESAFVVPSPPLAAQETTRAGTPPEWIAAAAKHAITYDLASAEASRRAKLGAPDALKALSSLVAEDPGDPVLTRDVGYSALDLGLTSQAYHLFRRVAERRPEEPQTYLAMADALGKMGNTDLAIACYEIGLIGQWDPRFGDWKEILRVQYLRFLRGILAGARTSSVPAYVRERAASIAERVDMSEADLVVMITWNTDDTDVDLHVIEPGGEECYYQHRETESGGRLTHDVTQGYGPEMYVARDTAHGDYRIEAHYFAANRNRATTRTRVHLTLVEGWGTDHEKVTERTVPLTLGRQVHELAVVRR